MGFHREGETWFRSRNDQSSVSFDSFLFSCHPFLIVLALFDSLIFGPIIHDVPSPDKLNTSVNNFYQFLKGKKDADAATAGFGSLVDVRDVAQLHIDALVTEGASNQRFSVSNSTFSFLSLPP